MKIGVVGLGYIGLVTSVVLAEAGNDITGIDIDIAKIELLKKWEPCIYEPGLRELLKKNKNRLSFSSDYSKLSDTEVIFITVPTPTENGKANIRYVYSAVESIAEVNKKAVIVIKSTVLPGTARELAKKSGMTVVSNPEFTKEGTAVYDTLNPDRVVIGGNDKNAVEKVNYIWAFTKAPVIKTTNENAELIKYASNSFLATKISYINEIADLCEIIPGCDAEIIAEGMGLDKRIAPYFLKAGIGFGGSCFPKDTAALVTFSKELGKETKIVKAAMEVNEGRINKTVSLLRQQLGDISKRRIGVLGITFKGDTDDIRGSQAIKLIKMLQSLDCYVNVYDPRAKDTPEGTRRFADLDSCIENSDALVIATEWTEFKSLKIENKPVIDMKRVLKPGSFKSLKSVGRYA